MKNEEAVLSLKFSSTYSAGELMEICRGDLEEFKKVPGLIQKFYIIEDSTGTLSGLYVFVNKEARASFWNSELAKSIPVRYSVIPGTLRIEQYDMEIVLNDGEWI